MMQKDTFTARSTHIQRQKNSTFLQAQTRVRIDAQDETLKPQSQVPKMKTADAESEGTETKMGGLLQENQRSQVQNLTS